jgi:hypothetical protein
MIELFLAKCCDEILRCSGNVWTGIVMQHHNTLTKHATSLVLDCTMQFLKCVAIDTYVHWSLKSETRIPQAEHVFCSKTLCTYLAGWNGLNFFFISNYVCLHSLDCCFDSGVTCDTHVSSRDYTVQEVNTLLTVSYQKVNALAWHFILCSPVSIFSTQHEHSFQKQSLSDTISWRSDCKIYGKCRESDKISNCLFSWIFS